MAIQTSCSCGQTIMASDEDAGHFTKCPSCGQAVRVPGVRRMGGGAGGEEESGMMGWVYFILIFGVGNLVLYNTTGIFLIPLPRR